MILTIKKAGLFLTLTGLKPFRTPAVVDISRVDMNVLRMELKRHGVRDYEITEEPLVEVKTPKKKPQKNPLAEKVDAIYKMMQQMLGKETTVEHHYHSAVQTLDRLVEEKFDEPDVEEFIPEIDVSDLKDVQLEYRTEEGEDVTDAAEELRKLKGAS